MSLLPKDTVKVIAETVGIPNLDDEIAVALASDVEYRIREISQEAIKFMRHSRRSYLTVEDVNNALRLRNVEAVYGYSAEAVRFRSVPGVPDLFYYDDPEVDLKEIIYNPLPPAPRETTWTAHWLAVEGVQPAIPENPSPASPLQQDRDDSKKRKLAAAGKGSGGEDNEGGGVKVKPMVKHVLSQELQMYYNLVVGAIRSQAFPDSQAAASASGALHNTDSAMNGISSGSTSQASGGESSSAALKQPQMPSAKQCLQSLARDPGLHQLVPYFTSFIADEVTKNLKKLPLLKALMRMVRALLVNPHLHIELYLHQVMSVVLTCVVSKQLCQSATEDHWALRDYAATTVAFVCHRYGESYQQLPPRVTKTLVSALLNPSKPLTTHYGAIVALTALGPHAVHVLLMPNVVPYMNLLHRENSNQSAAHQLEALHVYTALLLAVGKYIHSFVDLFTMPRPAPPPSTTHPAPGAPITTDAAPNGPVATESHGHTSAQRRLSQEGPVAHRPALAAGSSLHAPAAANTSFSSLLKQIQAKGTARASSSAAGPSSQPQRVPPDAERPIPVLPPDVPSASHIGAWRAGDRMGGDLAAAQRLFPEPAVPYEQLQELFGDALVPFAHRSVRYSIRDLLL